MSKKLFVVLIGCGSLRNNSLRSPGYPNKYPNMDCVYQIAIPQGMAIRMHFEYFELEDSWECRFVMFRLVWLIDITLFSTTSLFQI